MQIESRIKKWGHSYGILLPKYFVEEEHFSEEEPVLVHISKKKNLGKLFGLCRFRKPTKEIMKEIKEGYEE